MKTSLSRSYQILKISFVRFKQLKMTVTTHSAVAAVSGLRHYPKSICIGTFIKSNFLSK